MDRRFDERMDPSAHAPRGRRGGARLLGIGLTAAAALALSSGCVLFESSGSFSDSSGSISDSSGSSSASSRSSSGGDDSAYRQDVKRYAVAHVRAAGSPEGLRRGLGDVALARGISDWEGLTDTYEAVGAGLAEAGLPEGRLVAYERVLAGPGTTEQDALRRGYVAARR